MPANLRELMQEGVAGAPNRVVVTGDSTQLTWGDLHRQACRVATALVRDGVAPQQRVVFIGKNDPRYFEILFGCALAAAVLVPLNWRLAAGELATIIEDAQASVVIVDPDLVKSLPASDAKVVAPVARTLLARVRAADQLSRREDERPRASRPGWA